MDEYGAEIVQNLHFFYDAQSRPAFVEYDGTKYRYLHNLQGDITGIVDNTGNLVVEYKYDTWGKSISTSGSMADTLGKQNPFRYRGYIYDEETELYYLLSRYNNPKILRFINHDAFVSLAFQCGNGFMYCNNSPIILLDENGCDGYSVYINFYAPDVSNANFGHYDFSIVPNNGTMKYTYNGNEYSCEGMTFSFGPITSAGDENMSRDDIIETKFPARVNVYLCAQRTDVWDRILICDNISEDSINNYLSWFQKDCAEFINGDDPVVKVWYMKKNSGNGSYENYWIKKLLYCGTGMFWLLSHITGLFDPKVNKNSKALTDMKTTLHSSALAVTQDVINKFKESFASKH